jgi:predicted nucleic acid-binding protein
MMIYADANVIIRLLEGLPAVRARIEAHLLPFRGTAGFLATSRLSRLECRVKPLRAGDLALLALYDAFFASSEVVLWEIDAAVVEKATELRATLNIKTPDAIHLATAVLGKASGFLTGDRSLLRCTEVAVQIV